MLHESLKMRSLGSERFFSVVGTHVFFFSVSCILPAVPPLCRVTPTFSQSGIVRITASMSNCEDGSLSLLLMALRFPINVGPNWEDAGRALNREAAARAWTACEKFVCSYPGTTTVQGSWNGTGEPFSSYPPKFNRHEECNLANYYAYHQLTRGRDP